MADIYKNALAGDEPLELGAEPTGRYANDRMMSDYVGAGLSGAGAAGGGTLAALMAAEPTLFWKLFAPLMGTAAVGMGMNAADQVQSGNMYRRYRNDQQD